MAEEFEFVSASDKAALLAFTSPHWLEATRDALAGLGYKVHTAATHSDFVTRFFQIRYQVVILEELFACESVVENEALGVLQRMPMGQRRHATIILLGDSFQTFAPMQAFQFSVHAVINPSEILLLPQLIEKAVSDQQTFMATYREAQANLHAADKH